MTYEKVDPTEWDGVYYDKFKDRYTTINFPGDGIVVLEDVHYETPYYEFDEARFAEEADTFVEATAEDIAAAAPPSWRLHLHNGTATTKTLLSTGIKASALLLVFAIIAIVLVSTYVAVVDAVVLTADPISFNDDIAEEREFNDVRSSHETAAIPINQVETEVQLAVGTTRVTKSDEGNHLEVQAFSIPDKQVMGRSAHPLRLVPTGPMIERTLDAQSVKRTGSAEFEVGGGTKTAGTYTTGIEKQGQVVELEVLVARYPYDGDLIVVMAAYNKGAQDLRDDALALFSAIER